MKQTEFSPDGTRRRFLKWTSLGAISGAVGLTAGSITAAGQAATVRDRFWAWAHDAGSYNNSWGLPKNGRITPVEGAHYLGVPNIMMIRYAGKPVPPFEQYAIPFRSLKRVHWSVTGASGATSDEERKYVLQLAASMPNLAGVFMDDFFSGGEEVKPHWLAANHAVFPVLLSVNLPGPASPTELELVQSEWRSGDYRCKDVVVQLSVNGSEWREAARTRLPNSPAGSVSVRLPGTPIRALRLLVLNTHDTQGAISCGLRRLRLRAGTNEIPLQKAKVFATSTYPGLDAQNILSDGNTIISEMSAALSVEQLHSIRKQVDNVNGRKLVLGVTVYSHQLNSRMRAHLELCDVVSLWTWDFEDLNAMSANYEKLKSIVPDKEIWLGCYMWGFGGGKPIPIDLMRYQCELGLQWLKQGRIGGMIFLATNICDLGLEAVEWTQQWIAEVGGQPL